MSTLPFDVSNINAQNAGKYKVVFDDKGKPKLVPRNNPLGIFSPDQTMDYSRTVNDTANENTNTNPIINFIDRFKLQLLFTILLIIGIIGLLLNNNNVSDILQGAT